MPLFANSLAISDKNPAQLAGEEPEQNPAVWQRSFRDCKGQTIYKSDQKGLCGSWTLNQCWFKTSIWKTQGKKLFCELDFCRYRRSEKEIQGLRWKSTKRMMLLVT